MMMMMDTLKIGLSAPAPQGAQVVHEYNSFPPQHRPRLHSVVFQKTGGSQ